MLYTFWHSKILYIYFKPLKCLLPITNTFTFHQRLNCQPLNMKIICVNKNCLFVTFPPCFLFTLVMRNNKIYILKNSYSCKIIYQYLLINIGQYSYHFWETAIIQIILSSLATQTLCETMLNFSCSFMLPFYLFIYLYGKELIELP